jgi:curved DNA-binding protein CbpA
MSTLYDLLGALSDDGADEIRTAFRKAVKGAHPDLNPGDPDAALKFRRIVRANDILSDGEQRAAYDHLLTLAQEEEKTASRRNLAARVHKLASSIMALSGLAIATAGGYLLFMHISIASVGAGGPEREAAVLAQPRQPASGPTYVSTVRVQSLEPLDEAAAAQADDHDAAAAGPDTTSDLAGSIAKSYRARALAAYQEGDLNGAIADLDQALQVDPKFSAAYIDRATIFYRLHLTKAARAFGKAGKTSPAKPAAATAFPTTAFARMLPMPRPRATMQAAEWKAGLMSER